MGIADLCEDVVCFALLVRLATVYGHDSHALVIVIVIEDEVEK